MPCQNLNLNQQRIFLDLVDKGAPPKAFAAQLGLTLDEVRYHTTKIGFYRETVRLTDEIQKIRRSNLSTKEKNRRIGELRDGLELGQGD